MLVGVASVAVARAQDQHLQQKKQSMLTFIPCPIRLDYCSAYMFFSQDARDKVRSDNPNASFGESISRQG